MRTVEQSLTSLPRSSGRATLISGDPAADGERDDRVGRGGQAGANLAGGHVEQVDARASACSASGRSSPARASRTAAGSSLSRRRCTGPTWSRASERQARTGPVPVPGRCPAGRRASVRAWPDPGDRRQVHRSQHRPCGGNELRPGLGLAPLDPAPRAGALGEVLGRGCPRPPVCQGV